MSGTQPKIKWQPVDLMCCPRVEKFSPTNAFEFGASTGNPFRPVDCTSEGESLKITGAAISKQRRGYQNLWTWEIFLETGKTFELILTSVEEYGALLGYFNEGRVPLAVLELLHKLTSQRWKVTGEDGLGNKSWRAVR